MGRMNGIYHSLLVLGVMVSVWGAVETMGMSGQNVAGGKDAALYAENGSDLSGGNMVTNFGKDGLLQVFVPTGWEYECYRENSILKNRMDNFEMVGKFGMVVYPEGSSARKVDLAFRYTFGVCGFGLESEEVILAGDQAYIGTFDGKKNWDFVAFYGKNEGIVAWAYSAEDDLDSEAWSAKQTEQMMEMLDGLHFVKWYVKEKPADAEKKGNTAAWVNDTIG